ncbi:MAG: IS4 family transposase [Pseudobdellovibrionaceae bacterium]
MYQHGKNLSLFQLIDRKTFKQLVEKYEMDKWVRHFQTWEMTCALITALTVGLRSFREVEKVLGIPRSTFGDALSRRFSGFFSELCDQTLLQIKSQTKDRKVKRGIGQIIALDASEIRVHGSLFSSPGWQCRSSDQHIASAKLHLMWNVDGHWIDDHTISGNRLADVRAGRQFDLKPGLTYVFDRAYCEVNFWLDIMQANSHFVTRLKGKSIDALSHARSVERQDKDGVLYEGVYRPGKNIARSRFRTKKDRVHLKFRYIVYRDPQTKALFYFVTSNWSCSAQMVADIYKKRWGVELLFRWLKGHLNVRYLPIKNKNAIRTQLAVAILIQLLLQLKKLIDQFQGSLWELLREIRVGVLRQSIALSKPPDGCRWKHPLDHRSTPMKI